jgi:hypothetical protein
MTGNAHPFDDCVEEFSLPFPPIDGRILNNTNTIAYPGGGVGRTTSIPSSLATRSQAPAKWMFSYLSQPHTHKDDPLQA